MPHQSNMLLALLRGTTEQDTILDGYGGLSTPGVSVSG